MSHDLWILVLCNARWVFFAHAKTYLNFFEEFQEQFWRTGNLYQAKETNLSLTYPIADEPE